MKVQVLLVNAAEEDLHGDAAAELVMFKKAGGRLQCVNDANDLQLERLSA